QPRAPRRAHGPRPCTPGAAPSPKRNPPAPASRTDLAPRPARGLNQGAPNATADLTATGRTGRIAPRIVARGRRDGARTRLVSTTVYDRGQGLLGTNGHYGNKKTPNFSGFLTVSNIQSLLCYRYTIPHAIFRFMALQPFCLS